MHTPHTNWSGSVRFRPRTVAFPSSEEEVVHLVQQAAKAGHKIRVVGAAHSFTPLVETNDVLVSLGKMHLVF